MSRIVLWRQSGAAIGMLDHALRACPDELWRSRLWRDGAHGFEFSEFWKVDAGQEATSRPPQRDA